MKKIGLTGNIASGKSEIEKILRKKGFFVVDLEVVSHDLLENSEIIKSKILKEFQTLNRSEIGKIVFSDNKKRKILDDIFHPELKKYLLDLFKKDYEIIFISGALLYEAGFDCLFDKIIFIDSPFEIRLKRLIKRNNLDENEALKRLNAQNVSFKPKANFIVENDSNIDELEKKINKILERLL